MNKLLPIWVVVFFLTATTIASAQTYSTNSNKTIPGNYAEEIFDTLNINSLNPATLNATHGLNSVTLNITYDWTPDLVISLIAPDGTIAHLSDYEGWGGDFTNAVFSMNTTNLVQNSGNPFSGDQRPEEWLGKINNGQNGNGNWVLHIINFTGGFDEGTLLNWNMNFNNTPAPPNFFLTSNIPIVVLNTNDVVVTRDDANAHMGIIDNGMNVNHVNDPFNNYDGNITMHIRGSSSASFPTKSYTVSTKDVNGDDTDAALLAMPADHSWVLYAPWDDKSLIRDVITYGISNDMGAYAPRTRMVQLVMNGDYRGVYVLEEKISRGSNRVNVHKMNNGDTSGNSLTGGYIFECDRGTPGYDSWQGPIEDCSGSGYYPVYAYVYPKLEDITTQQANYISSYTDSFEYAVANGNLYDSVNGYRKYIDVPSFIDEMLLQELGHNVDGYRLSTYFHKDRGGKLMGGPIWDFNLAYGNADYNDGWRYNVFEFNQPCPDPGFNPFYWKVLTTDTNYYNEMRCRYSNLRLSAFDTAHIQGLIDSLAGVLTVPAANHYERWPVLGVYLWPNYFVGNSYPEEVNYLKLWLRKRIQFMDDSLFRPACIDTANADTTNPVNPTGLATLSAASIKLYPNPVTDHLVITATAMMNGITIYNMLGQQVYSTAAATKKYDIAMQGAGLPSGIYTVNIYGSSGEVIKRKIVLSD